MYSSSSQSSKSKKGSQPIKNNPVLDFKTKQTLNNNLCEQTFKNALRGDGEKVHNENRLAYVDPKIRKKREQTSHIFSGEEPKPNEHKPMVATRYIPSNVMFNDDYVEKNPKINVQKKVRYEVEKQMKDDSKKQYAAELVISPQRMNGLQRKIQENYKTNPMEILTPEQNQHINEQKRIQVAKKTEAYKGYMGSEKIKKTFRSMAKDPYAKEKVSKITNDDFETYQRALVLKKEEPNYGKRHFRVASMGSGAAFTYM